MTPERHLPLLQALADRGTIVVAPHFERLESPIGSEAYLLLRARRLRLALAGAKGSTLAGERLAIAKDARSKRLAPCAL